MGSDGITGLLHLRKNGGYTLCQDEHSSVVYEMPKRAWEAKAAQKQVSLYQMSNAMKQGMSNLHEPKSQ